MSDELVLREVGLLRYVTCIVPERQLRLYGHVARLHAEDPAHRILSCRVFDDECIIFDPSIGDNFTRITGPQII